MEVDGADGEVLGLEQHAALRGGVFWLDPPSSHSQTSGSLPAVSTIAQQQQQWQRGPATEQEQPGGSKSGGAQGEDSSAAGAHASEGAKQAPGGFMYGGGGGSILLFDAGNPCPRAAWLLPR